MVVPGEQTQLQELRDRFIFGRFTRPRQKPLILFVIQSMFDFVHVLLLLLPLILQFVHQRNVPFAFLAIFRWIL